MYSEIIDVFTILFGLVPGVIILIAAVRYVRANPGTEGMLMVTGSTITIIGDVGFGLGRFAYAFFNSSGAIEALYRYLSYGFILGGLLFTAGLLLLVMKEAPQGAESTVPPSV